MMRMKCIKCLIPCVLNLCVSVFLTQCSLSLHILSRFVQLYLVSGLTFCVFVCIYVCVHVCVRARARVCVHEWIRVCICVCVWVWVFAYIYMCAGRVCACIYVHDRVCVNPIKTERRHLSLNASCNQCFEGVVYLRSGSTVYMATVNNFSIPHLFFLLKF